MVTQNHGSYKARTVEETTPDMEDIREEMVGYLYEDPTEKGSKWSHQYTKKGVRVCRWNVPDCKYDFFRGDYEVDLPMGQIWDYAADDSTRFDWDKSNTKEIRVVQSMKPDGAVPGADGIDLVYIRFKSPSPFLSARDTLMLRLCGSTNDDECRYAVLTSVTDETVPVPKGIVRGLVVRSALMFKKISEERTIISYIFMTDPVGSVPYSLARVMLGNQAECVGTIGRFAVKKYKN